MKLLLALMIFGTGVIYYSGYPALALTCSNIFLIHAMTFKEGS
jgi:hypothetical protein